MKLVDEEVLGLTRNISQIDRDAPFELKRQYLRLFFEKIYVEDKKVGKLHETPIFSTLRKQQQVIIKKNWLPHQVSIRTTDYLQSILFGNSLEDIIVIPAF